MDAMSGCGSSFNIIHLESIEKIDIFVLRDDAFSRDVLSRMQPYDIGEGRTLYVCSPEDIVLQKLVWFKMTTNESQKQWRDILGVLKLQDDKLDFNYMRAWASHLSLTQEMLRAWGEASRG
jgi:aspartate carbamoyltransferase catalytic subunit